MRPVLFDLPAWLGGLPVPSYGLSLALGTLATALVFRWLAGLAGAERGRAFRVTLETAFVAMLAARAAGVLVAPPGTTITARFVAASAGVWYPGLLAGVAYFAVRSRSLGLGRLDALDRLLPAVALGHAIGRVGCFLAGCCWGKACNLPWAVVFPEAAGGPPTGVPTGVPLHPTQLYEVAADVALFSLPCWWLLTRRAFVGQVALLGLAGYAAVRFASELVRGDERGGVGPLSTSQLVALLVLFVTVPLLTWRGRRGGLGRATEAG